MRPNHRTILVLLTTVLALATPAISASRPGGPPAPPIVTALLAPADGAVVDASSRPTFAFEATPGGRFRVEFSSSGNPFLPTLNSGHRTTPGDQFKPSTQQWRAILSLAGSGNTVYWRVVALGMTADQMAAAPISSFTVSR